MAPLWCYQCPPSGPVEAPPARKGPRRGHAVQAPLREIHKITVQTISVSATMVARKRRNSFSLWGSASAVWHSICTHCSVVECLQSRSPGRPPQVGVVLCPSPRTGAARW
jgi:hypothetical protein